VSSLFASGPSRFDAILLFIALAVGGGVGLAAISSLSLQAGGSVGSLLASVAMFDGIVRNPPGEE
jgi:hypothetical protein